MSKIYPEEAYFVVPGKGAMPLWKQQELARDPSFRDLGETIKDMESKGSGSSWSSRDGVSLRVRTPNQRLEVRSAKHGYETTFREEAAVLKANTREAKAQEKKAIEAIQKTRLPEGSGVADSCCTIC